jgi:hypothetical protein
MGAGVARWFPSVHSRLFGFPGDASFVATRRTGHGGHLQMILAAFRALPPRSTGGGREEFHAPSRPI